jgi:hypothetical protein
MSEEMAVPDHPHADQRNWHPGDTDDDDGPRFTFEQILAFPRIRNRLVRTLKRVAKWSLFFPPELFAAAIIKHIRIDQVLDIAAWLEDVAKHIGKQMQQTTEVCRVRQQRSF